MKKVLIYTTLALSAMLIFAGCAPASASDTANSQASEASVQRISAEDAKALLDAEDVLLLDVRTQSEYDSGHIDGAVLLPYDTITADSAALPEDKSAAIMVYCRTGGRSAAAAKTLAGLGYTQIYDLGGIQSWPYETVS